LKPSQSACSLAVRAIASGTKISGASSVIVPENPAGATPTMVIGSPLTTTDDPTTDRSAPKLVLQ